MTSLVRRALLAAPALLGAAPALALPPGSHRITFAEPTGAAPGAMAVFLHRPATWRPDGPVVAVMHGIRRDAEAYRDAWVPHAEAQGFLLVCPEFSDSAFPGDRWYILGNVIDGAGETQPAERWTFTALDRAVDAARQATGALRERYALYGHSAGAQFVHRALLLTGAPRATVLLIANAGWYSVPRFDIAFPFGLGRTACTEATLAAALCRPVILLLGEQDTDPHHRSLRRDAGSDAQGINRVQRGHNFYDAAQAAAARAGVTCTWRLETVPGVGHSNVGMAQAAAPLLGAA